MSDTTLAFASSSSRAIRRIEGGKGPQHTDHTVAGLAHVPSSIEQRGLVGNARDVRQLQVRGRSHEMNQPVQGDYDRSNHDEHFLHVVSPESRIVNRRAEELAFGFETRCPKIPTGTHPGWNHVAAERRFGFENTTEVYESERPAFGIAPPPHPNGMRSSVVVDLELHWLRFSSERRDGVTSVRRGPSHVLTNE